MTTTIVEEIPDYRVVDALTETVRKRGADYVYKKIDGACKYRVDDKPDCLVGHVLARLVPDYEPDEVSVQALRTVFKELGFSNRAILALQVAQSVQDDSHTWGAALTAARSVFDHYHLFADE